MGLLDINMPGMDTPEGQGLLSAAFSLMSAQKLPGQRGAMAGALGDAGRQYLGTTNDARNQSQRRAMGDLQMQAQQMQLDEAQRRRKQETADMAALRGAFSPMTPGAALAGGGGPTSANAARIGQMPRFDPRTFLQNYPGASMDALKEGMSLNSAMNPAPKFMNVAPGASVLRQSDDGSLTPAFTAPDKPEASPELTRLINQMQALPEGSPFRKFYQDAINKATTHQPGTSVSVNTGQKGFDNTLKLRGDFRSEPIYKAHQDVQSAYAQISTALRQASPAGDLAGATKLMKILDPGSVVRESELGMAMAASGALDRLMNYGNLVLTGQKLTPTQRKDFQKLADSLYGESVKQYNAKRDEYKGIADRNDLNAMDILGPQGVAPASAENGAQTTNPRAAMQTMPPANPANRGKRIRDTATGEVYTSNGMQWKKETR